MLRTNNIIDDVAKDLAQLDLGSSYWNLDVNPTDILQRQSINSLLSGGNAGHVSPQEGDTLTVNELFGLNKPRSTTLSSSCEEVDPVGSPPKNYFNDSLSTPVKTPQSSRWMDNSFFTPPRYDSTSSTSRFSPPSGYSQANSSISSYNSSNDSRRVEEPRQRYGDYMGHASNCWSTPTRPIHNYASSENQQPDLSTILQNSSRVRSSLGDIWEKYRVLDRYMQLTDVDLDREVMFHRTAASWYEATCAWSGTLPKRPAISLNSNFASKIFLGGVPWDSTEQQVISVFSRFGNVQVEWPGKNRNSEKPRGHLYLSFDSQFQVKRLLAACTSEVNEAGEEKWYFKFSSANYKNKLLQVIPWTLRESYYTAVDNINFQLDTTKTVFVGAVHGTLNAEGLAKILNDLFGGVVSVNLDIDKWKYPIGSARVTFNNLRSYKKAINAAFVQVKTEKIDKKIQLDPYLEETKCSRCGQFRGIYFCRDLSCFKYYCCICWRIFHVDMETHKPIAKRIRQVPLL